MFGGVDAFRSVTGLPISPYFSATKYLWMLENIPQVCVCVRVCVWGGGRGRAISPFVYVVLRCDVGSVDIPPFLCCLTLVACVLGSGS